MELKEVRKKVNELLAGNNNVDKLMTDKVNDYILLDEQPLPVRVGDRTIFIGNFTIDNNYKFWQMYGQLMAIIGLKFINFDLISKTTDLYKAIMLHRRLYKGLIKIIKKTVLKQQAFYLNKEKVRQEMKWKNCTYSYFKKHITIENLLQICYLIWLFNFDAEKKNLKILFQRMLDEDQRPIMATYMYYWLRNCPGLTGKFQLALLTNVDYWDDESQSDIIPVKDKEKKNVS